MIARLLILCVYNFIKNKYIKYIFCVNYHKIVKHIYIYVKYIGRGCSYIMWRNSMLFPDLGHENNAY